MKPIKPKVDIEVVNITKQDVDLVDSMVNEVGKPCPHCKKGKLEVVEGTRPHEQSYLICDYCCSTYNL